MRRPVKIAVVGGGWVGTHRHIPALRRHGGFDLVGVIDRNEGKVRKLSAAFGCSRTSTTDNLDSVPWLDEVDAVVIATSPFTHYPLISTALERGKHVLTEKPFAMEVGEGERLVELARARQRVLAIVHNFQFAGSTKRLEHDLHAGTLGDVRGIVARQYGNPLRRLPDWYEQLPFGLFYDESPHLLYLIKRLSPGPLRLLACDVFPSTEGRVTPALIQAQYSCETPSGFIPVTLSMHFESPVSEWHVAVLGTRALGDVDVFRDIYVRVPNDGSHSTWSVVRTSVAATWQHWAQHLSIGPRHATGRLLYGNDEVYARFHRAIVEDAALQGVSAADGLHVLRMQHEVIDQANALIRR